MKAILLMALAVAAIVCESAEPSRPTPMRRDFSVYVPAVSVGDVIPGVFGCPDINAPDCRPRSVEPYPGQIRIAPDQAERIAQAYGRGGHCSLDLVNAKLAASVTYVERRSGLKVGGWAFNGDEIPEQTVLQLTTSSSLYRGMLDRITRRPDIARSFDRPQLSNAGFDGDFSLDNVPAGTYDVLLLLTTGRDMTICSTGRKIRIEDR